MSLNNGLSEEGGYWGEVLEPPGCVSQGETLEEFRHNVREAIDAVLEAEMEGSHEVFQGPQTGTAGGFPAELIEPKETWTPVHY